MPKLKMRGYHDGIPADVDLLPLMNIFVTLIPMLLLSAVFLKMAVVDLNLPGEAEVRADAPPESFTISVLIEADRYRVEAPGMASRDIERTGENAVQGLGQALGAITSAHPAAQDVQIVSQAHTRYEEIIAVMDVSRGAGLRNASLREADGASAELGEGR